ncbi:hypothetical protein ACQ4M3_41880 [Leptolyngbya sp. AN03gr2]|uniref:hypothetical protein n=1 Tax=unclassified Leptolyngbya TaxID=2650499 RepID=UPI003D31F1FD
MAQQLERKFQVEFLIEEIQPHWLRSKGRKQYEFFARLITGGIFGVVSSLMVLTTVVVLYNSIELNKHWLRLLSITIFAPFLWLFFAEKLKIGGGEIYLTERISWSWSNLKDYFSFIKKAKSFQILLAIYAAFISLCTMFGQLFGMSENILIRVFFGVVFGSMLLLTTFLHSLQYGFRGQQLEMTYFPNQRMYICLSNVVFFALSFSLLFSLSYGFLNYMYSLSGLSLPFEQSKEIINWFGITFSKLQYSVIAGLIQGAYMGLVTGALVGDALACVDHFCLRCILFFNNSIPWNYARFLNYATERMFLQKIGGRYRFIHKLLQDHFAQLER